MLARRRSGDRVPKQPAAPKVFNQAKARAVLEQAGWTRTLGGKHVVKMVKEGHPPITIPMHKGRDYGPGLRAAILKQAGLN
jgi:predicted RNA binding protein YcfA (HicA-like mRNA interferase family)